MSKRIKRYNKKKRLAENKYHESLRDIVKIVGNKTTHSSQLEYFGKKLFGKNFVGVFTCDLIPKKIPRGHFAIVNLDSSDMTGSHWVSIAKEEESDTIWVYDSFGRSTHKILPSIYGEGRKIKTTERDPEQDNEETNCGARSLAFLKVFHDLGHDYAKYI